jgi:hypothetical protein
MDALRSNDQGCRGCPKLEVCSDMHPSRLFAGIRLNVYHYLLEVSSYLWIVRWRADYRPESPFPPLSHSFWDDPTAKYDPRKSKGRTQKRGMKFGLWAGAWNDDLVHEDDDDRYDGDIAGVYVPFVPGFNRAFTHV